MAVYVKRVIGGNGLNYTRECDSPSDYSAIPVSTWFKDLSDNIVRFKNSVSGIFEPNKYNSLLNINTQTGTSYTIQLSDALFDTWIRMNNASANSVTIPLNATVSIAIGTQIPIFQIGAGQTTIVATGGVTINNNGLKIASRYNGLCLVKVGTDEWDIVGTLTT